MKVKTLKKICITVTGVSILLGSVIVSQDTAAAKPKTGVKTEAKTEAKTEVKTEAKTEAKTDKTDYPDIIGDRSNEEEAFTADDLKKYLENEGKNKEKDDIKESGTEDPETDNDSKEERWKKFMELSLNGTVSEDGAVFGNETVSENKTDPKNDENTNNYYVPSKGQEWKLLLVNKQNLIPDEYDAQLVHINGNARIREEVALPLAEMFDAAEKDGVTLTVCSAYRSHEHQQELFDRKIRGYSKQGLSYLDAFRIGSYSVIIPGTSEHELGMALDIVTPGYTELNEGFAKTKAGRWLAVNAYKYGFILRYPEGKEYITGIIFEPWHYRYVGKEAAKDIYKSGLTLEEYLKEIGWQ
jgi:D-alanyl-D-alanine carboxypeptidase